MAIDSGAARLAIQLLLARALEIPAEKATEHPHISWLNEANENITRAMIVGVLHELSLTVLDPGKPRFIVIEHANRLTTEAANALLKALEEPPPATHFILQARTASSLMPTIRSRVQIVSLPASTMAEAGLMGDEMSELASQFLDSGVASRLAIVADTHKQGNDAELVRAIYQKLAVNRNYPVLSWLEPYMPSIEKSGNVRLLLEALSLKLDM
ncbi:hypothetical protein KBC99_01635 [Candidatus Saccharibacteria bacterium]|nr:hypothetical protein [Candidatus Saccharibacteria bacterium]